MNHSESLNELATALAKAQSKITGALKDSANPFFKSRYADLASCWDACRQPLSENGLAVMQPAESCEVGVTVITMLVHTSGQWLRTELRLAPKDFTPQSIGSCISYGRRYALTALIGIAQVDDDGNAASGRTNGAYAEPHRPQGDLAKAVPEDLAMAEATAMRGILEEDLEERVRQLKVLDRHDALNARGAEFYIAASEQLTAKERASWKTYVSLAKAAQKADEATSPTRGRRW